MQRRLARVVFAATVGLGGCGDPSSETPDDGGAGESGDTAGDGPTTGQPSTSDDPTTAPGGTTGGIGTTADDTGAGTDAGTTDAPADSTGATNDDAPVHIVVLGASTACGKNLDQPQHGGMAGGLASSWVNRYADELLTARPGSMVTNLCQAGYNTYHAMPTGTTNPPGMPMVDPAKNVTAALALSPDAVIVAFPASDETSNIPEIVGNLQTIADTAAAADVPVWISTPQPVEDMPPAALANKLQLRDDVLATWGDHALDFWAPLATPGDMWDPAKMLTDGVHPNAVGHGLLLEVVSAADIPGAVTGS